ncbi:MAG TPA: NHL repeat-containing protein [Candidatus Dormibacteraeota bacterium]|nr:NHL repeat-containing protein [Candidatus Dormibacteraeota bacterium]
MVRFRHRAAAVGGLLALSLLATGCGAGAAPSAVAKPTAGPGTALGATPAVPPLPSVASSPAPALELLWERSGDTTLSGGNPATYWPAVDPKTGDVWVALGANGLYWIFSPDGKFLGSSGAPGTGPGQFNFRRTACPDCVAGAIAFAPDGSFFVADDGNNRIQKFDSAHKFVKAWGSFGSGDGQFADANAIATDGKAVYVNDDARGDIQVFDADGRFLRSFAGPGGWLAIDKDGNLFVMDNSSTTAAINEYDAAGGLRHRFDLPSFEGDHIGLAVDATGRLFFNIQSRQSPDPALGLVRFDPTSSTITRWSTGGETLAIAPTQDAIYEANFVSAGWPSPLLRKYALPAK